MEQQKTDEEKNALRAPWGYQTDYNSWQEVVNVVGDFGNELREIVEGQCYG